MDTDLWLRHAFSDVEAVAHVGFWSLVRRTGACDWSDGFYELLELDRAVPPSLQAYSALLVPEDRDAFDRAMASASELSKPCEQVHHLVTPLGRRKTVLCRARVVREDGGGDAVRAIVGVVVDLTNQQQVREKLDDASAQLMAVWEHALDAYFLTEPDGTIVECNPAAERLLLRGREELIGTDLVAAHFRAEIAVPVSRRESTLADALGASIPVEVSTSGSFRFGRRELVVVSAHDTRARRLVERRARRLAETNAAVARTSAACVRAATREQLLEGICGAIVGGSVVLAWVGEPVDDAEKSCRRLAVAGPAAGYIEHLPFGWDDGTALGRGAFGMAVRTRTPVRMSVDDPRFAPWRDRSAARGIAVVLALPIVEESGPVVYSLCSDDAEAFGPTELLLYESFAADLGLALRSIRLRDAMERLAERERERAAEVEAALEGALSALTATHESRDPYTAGHERQVADLARAIAAEAGVDEGRSRALYLAALVHDIGKIAIPSELLTKPGRLSASEFRLVQEHPNVGYEIMLKIPFRWDVAEIVRQHHEYLDGSGYPRGLLGDAILFESRILTVADIVDAMTAFRPYHAARSMDEACEEVRRQAGRRLDAAVVEAFERVVVRGAFVPRRPPDVDGASLPDYPRLN